jgi:hypothetical protein
MQQGIRAFAASDMLGQAIAIPRPRKWKRVIVLAVFRPELLQGEGRRKAFNPAQTRLLPHRTLPGRLQRSAAEWKAIRDPAQ